MSIFIVFSIVVAILCAGFYFFLRKIQRKRLFESLELKLFLVRLPRGTKEGKNVQQEINITEQLLGALANFKKPFALEVAVPHIGKEIHFYVAVHKSFSEALVRQIESLWDEVHVAPAEDYNIFNYSGSTIAARVALKDRFVLPIRTYEDLKADTFLPFLGGFSKVNEVGEGA